MITDISRFKVSIITPIKNGFILFDSTYDSVVAQSHGNFEWFIVDDGSSAEQIEQIRNLARDPRVTYIETGGGNGPGRARNIGLSHASGDYITFIDSDDLWSESFIEEMLRFALAQDAGFVFSGYSRLKLETGERMEDFIPNRRVTSEIILAGSDISCLTALLRKDIVGPEVRFGDIPSRNDLVFFYRALRIIDAAIPYSKPLATYRIRSGSVSSNKLKALRYMYFVNHRIAGKSVLKSAANCLKWALYGLRKYSA